MIEDELHDRISRLKDEMLTSKFIFLHFPRTGGTSLRRILPQIPGARQHISWAHAPHDFYVGLCALLNIPVPPAFVFVRNPYAWYPSQWRWQIQVGEDMPFRDWMKKVGGFAKRSPDSIPGDLVPNVCPMTRVWDYMQCDRADYVGRYEDYGNEVFRILYSLCGVEEWWVRDKIEGAGRRKRTALLDSSYEEYYDDDTRGWVGKWDAGLIKRFNYTFGGEK